MRRPIAAVAVVVCIVTNAPTATATEVRAGTGAGGNTADLTARAGGSGGTRSGPASGTSAPGCYSQVIDFSGEGDLVIVPCDYHEGMAGPFAPFEPAQGQPTAAQVGTAARELVRSLPVPSPTPTMSATVGITGARHSLDLNVDNRIYFPSEDTTFGPLSAVAYGEFFVDWGDGTRETFTTTGGAWPNTDISHTWSRTGTYVITVEGRWSVDWQLGGFSGVVGGLQTRGEISGFGVIEAQAVLRD